MTSKTVNKIIIHNNTEYKVDVPVSPHDDRDWNSAFCMIPVGRIGEIPETLDYRPHIRPVRDQGKEGTCASFSACAMKEVQENIDCGFNGYFSPQFFYDQRGNVNEGMHSRRVMELLYSVGVIREKMYKYGTHNVITEEMKKEAEKFRISHYARVNSVVDAKNALYQTGPLLIAVPVFGTSDMTRMWFPNGPVRGGHMMCIMGYTKDSFIIRNSWGERFGDGGYCYFPFDDWAYAWEVWTTTDAESKDVPPEMLLGSANFRGEKVKL